MSQCSESEDAVTVMNAATVVILRRVKGGTAATSAATKNPKWKVLLGQNLVKNWLRSTPERDVIMRYPGEWKFPGGVQEDTDASLRETALRELREEFIGLEIPEHCTPTLRLINRKLTRPIQGRQYWMHNYAALDEENPWIGEMADANGNGSSSCSSSSSSCSESATNSGDTDDPLASKVNQHLTQRVQRFESMLADGSYWSLTPEQKSTVSPELMWVRWMCLDSAIALMSSEKDAAHLPFVNDWQREQFARYGVSGRDPMYQSMVTLQEVQALGGVEEIRRRDAEMTDRHDFV